MAGSIPADSTRLTGRRKMNGLKIVVDDTFKILGAGWSVNTDSPDVIDLFTTPSNVIYLSDAG